MNLHCELSPKTYGPVDELIVRGVMGHGHAWLNTVAPKDETTGHGQVCAGEKQLVFAPR